MKIKALYAIVCAAIVTGASGCASGSWSQDEGPVEHSGIDTQGIIGGVKTTAYPSAALLDMQSSSGQSYACTAAVIAPLVVLTAGHCVAGMASWTVTAGGTSQTSTSAETYDWTNNGSTVNPAQHDIGLVYLSQPIVLDAYPTLADQPVPDGTSAVDVGRIKNGAVTSDLYSAPVTLKDATPVGFPFDYQAAAVVEHGDSGGPVFLAGTQKIVAVNSGVGGGIEVLAKVDLLYTWIRQRMDAQGAASSATGMSIFTGTTLTVVVGAGDSAIISLRPLDKAILVNGEVTPNVKGVAANTQGAPVKKIRIVEDSSRAGEKSIVIDYTNGTFATGTRTGVSCPATEAAAAGGIWLAAGTSDHVNSLGIKGKSTADKITFGAKGVNVSGNSCADISWAGTSGTGAMGGISTFVVAMGDGDDSWFAGGDAATGAPFDNSSPLNAGGVPGVTVYGGAGNDKFLQGDQSHMARYETIYGGGDSLDTVDYSSRTGVVSVTVGAGVADDGDVASDEHDSIEKDIRVVHGGANDDLLTACPSAGGTDYPVTLNGNGGNDILKPHGGAYVMNGGAGNDIFDMGDDIDTHGAGSLLGGAGIDTIDFTKRSLYGVKVDLNSAFTLTATALTWTGTPVVSGKAQASGSLTTPGAAATEGVRCGNDIENVLGTDWADAITGNARDNKITGNQGDDVLNGGLGDDVFDESISAAGLAGGALTSGADTIIGGGGADTVDYSSRQSGLWVALDGVAHSGAFSSGGGASMVQIFGDASDDPPYSTQACAAPIAGPGNEGDSIAKDVENVLGGEGDDCLFGQPVGDAVCAKAGACANQLSGGLGNDLLFGNDDDDVLEGGPNGNSEVNGLDCGGAQGNLGRSAGSGTGSYQVHCQFQF